MGQKSDKPAAGEAVTGEATSHRIVHPDGTVEYIAKGIDDDEPVDHQSANSFPASDPPSFAPESHPEKPRRHP